MRNPILIPDLGGPQLTLAILIAAACRTTRDVSAKELPLLYRYAGMESPGKPCIEYYLQPLLKQKIVSRPRRGLYAPGAVNQVAYVPCYCRAEIERRYWEICGVRFPARQEVSLSEQAERLYESLTRYRETVRATVAKAETAPSLDELLQKLTRRPLGDYRLKDLLPQLTEIRQAAEREREAGIYTTTSLDGLITACIDTMAPLDDLPVYIQRLTLAQPAQPELRVAA